MRRRKAAFALVAALALSAGCAGGDQSVSTEPEKAPETSSPEKSGPEESGPEESTPAETETGKPARFEKRADLIERDWPEQPEPVKGRPSDMLPLEGAEKAAEDATTLTVTVGHGACDADFGVHLRESGELVIVSGWAKEKDVDVCADQFLTDDVEVELADELGERTVVDAATGEELPR